MRAGISAPHAQSPWGTRTILEIPAVGRQCRRAGERRSRPGLSRVARGGDRRCARYLRGSRRPGRCRAGDPLDGRRRRYADHLSARQRAARPGPRRRLDCRSQRPRGGLTQVATRAAAMPHSKPAQCLRLDQTGARCRSTVGSWSRERLSFDGFQPERRSGSCLPAGWQATPCRPGSPPA